MHHKQLLDHGYVKLIEHWGSDERIIESARMSTQGGFVSWDAYPKHPSGDKGLLAYLHRKKHTTPFEMCGFTVEVQAPIMVFREWHRHRTQSYSEASARYAPLPDVNYLPTLDRCLRGTQPANHQSQALAGSMTLDDLTAEEWLDRLAQHYAAAEQLYQDGLRWGVPKELARLCLPVGRHSRMRASANLHNWLRFLALRMDQGAQEEIRVYAEAVGEIVAELFPRTWALFQEGRSSGSPQP